MKALFKCDRCQAIHPTQATAERCENLHQEPIYQIGQEVIYKKNTIAEASYIVREIFTIPLCYNEFIYRLESNYTANKNKQVMKYCLVRGCDISS